MKKVLLFILATLALAGCTANNAPANDPLNLFNDKPAIKVEDGTEKDPLNLFGDTQSTTNTTSTRQSSELSLKEICAKYIPEATKVLQKQQEDMRVSGDKKYESSLNKIAYSKKLNTCVEEDFIYESLDSYWMIFTDSLTAKKTYTIQFIGKAPAEGFADTDWYTTNDSTDYDNKISQKEKELDLLE